MSAVAANLGILVVGESLILVYIGLNVIGMDEFHYNTFCFELLFFFGMTTILIVREKSYFFRSRPSNTLIIAILVDACIMILICSLQIIPTLVPIPIWHTAIIIGFACVANFTVNDLFKVMLFKFFF